mmetsp:Transcript_29236/g.86504  ORF Transcript_29236/g.86504 Transcript_29236/m.86504 type:complete len:394 (-) Transcript_29236:84-1265(-)
MGRCMGCRMRRFMGTKATTACTTHSAAHHTAPSATHNSIPAKRQCLLLAAVQRVPAAGCPLRAGGKVCPAVAATERVRPVALLATITEATPTAQQYRCRQWLAGARPPLAASRWHPLQRRHRRCHLRRHNMRRMYKAPRQTTCLVRRPHQNCTASHCRKCTRPRPQWAASHKTRLRTLRRACTPRPPRCTITRSTTAGGAAKAAAATPTSLSPRCAPRPQRNRLGASYLRRRHRRSSPTTTARQQRTCRLAAATPTLPAPSLAGAAGAQRLCGRRLRRTTMGQLPRCKPLGRRRHTHWLPSRTRQLRSSSRRTRAAGSRVLAAFPSDWAEARTGGWHTPRSRAACLDRPRACRRVRSRRRRRQRRSAPPASAPSVPCRAATRRAAARQPWAGH